MYTFWILVSALMAGTPDGKKKSTEESRFYSIENYRGWSSLMTTRIRHIRCIRLF